MLEQLHFGPRLKMIAHPDHANAPESGVIR
jgi:hypothetical protein